MKTISRMLILLVLGVVLVTPLSGIAQKTKKAERTLVGYVSDNHCGLKHMAGMGEEKKCTLACGKKRKIVLSDRDHKRGYQLDKNGPQKAGEVGRQKGTGARRGNGKTIKGTAIEAG